MLFRSVLHKDVWRIRLVPGQETLQFYRDSVGRVFGRQLAELSAITAVVVGGTPLNGGRVRILGTVAGALLMQLITATLIKHNLPTSAGLMVQAVIIVVAVLLQRPRLAGAR